jgi:hypothetical protein
MVVEKAAHQGVIYTDMIVMLNLIQGIDISCVD